MMFPVYQSYTHPLLNFRNTLNTLNLFKHITIASLASNRPWPRLVACEWQIFFLFQSCLKPKLSLTCFPLVYFLFPFLQRWKRKGAWSWITIVSINQNQCCHWVLATSSSTNVVSLNQQLSSSRSLDIWN